MKAKTSAQIALARKEIVTRIAAAQKRADVAKKAAKVSKLGAQQAKQKFKLARRAAKKLRKMVKSLRAELATLVAKKPARKPATKAAVRRPRPVITATLAPAAEPTGASEIPSTAPAAENSAPVQ